MKKILIVILCILLAISLIGCGNTDEYNQKLYEYYTNNLVLSDSISQSLKAFTNSCYELDVADVALSDLEADKILESSAKVKETISTLFASLKDPPSQCKDAYAIAERIYEAHLGIQITQENAYKEAPAGQAMTYVNIATDYFTDYVDALGELQAYFTEIGFEPTSKAEASPATK